MIMTVKNADRACERLFHLTLASDLHIMAPTIIKAPPDAQGGILAMMGAKKMLKRKKNPQNTAVNPVRDPTATPDPDSM